LDFIFANISIDPALVVQSLWNKIIMLRYIPFEEIEKNKWNGCVHYALNGNVQGYYWYLKAVLSEWGAIVENDYETVVPVILEPLKDYQYELLKELGPYSVNMIAPGTAKEIFSILEKHNKSSKYPLNSSISSSIVEKYNPTTKLKAVFQGGKNYLKLTDSYGDTFSKNLYEEGFDDVSIMSGKKPEEIVALLNVSDEHKNALLRIMYNGIHRGVGFTNGIQDKASGKILSMSFFLGTPRSIHELINYSSGNKKYRQFIFDLLLRNNAERPIYMETFQNIDDLFELGFDKEKVGDLQFKIGTIMKLKKALGGKY